jgi:hypothetical protein
MTNEEQQAEEIRLKLEALHRKILMDFADEIRRECAEKAYKWVVINIGGDDCGNNLDEMDSFIMGKEAGE